MNPRPLIIAQGPPSPAHETRPALDGTQAGARIARLAGLPDIAALLALVDTTHLCPTYVDVLLPQVGRHYAQRLTERIRDERRSTIVILGTPAALALGAHHAGLHQPSWRPKLWTAPGGAGGPCWWVTPQPVGLNRWWADELNVARASRFWRWLAGVASRSAVPERPAVGEPEAPGGVR